MIIKNLSMKKIILLFCFFISFLSNAQNSYIVDKKGKKTFVRDDAIDVILIDKRISYKLPGKTWEKYITYKHLDYAIFNGRYFKSFKLNRKRKALFVIAEEGNKKLAGISVVTTTSRGSYSNSILRVQYYVIENDDTILLEIKANDTKSGAAKRKKIASQIKRHFPNCQELIDRLNNYSESDDKAILSLTNSSYINCN